MRCSLSMGIVVLLAGSQNLVDKGCRYVNICWLYSYDYSYLTYTSFPDPEIVRTVRGTVRVQVVGFRTSMEGLGLPVLPLRQGLKSENPDG